MKQANKKHGSGATKTKARTSRHTKVLAMKQSSGPRKTWIAQSELSEDQVWDKEIANQRRFLELLPDEMLAQYPYMRGVGFVESALANLILQERNSPLAGEAAPALCKALRLTKCKGGKP